MATRNNHDYNCKCWKCRYFRKRETKDDPPEEMNLITDAKGCQTTNSILYSRESESKKILYSNKNIKKRRENRIEMNRLESNFTHGLIKIQNSNGFVSNQDGNHYLKIKPEQNEVGFIEVPKFMATVWNMKSPQIIIPIVTGITNFKNWKNQKLEEKFRRGLIKAANKTEMWFITNGVNGGIPGMIGEAFNEEKLLRATTGPTTNMYTSLNSWTIKPLTLIGIVSAKTLLNSSAFDGKTSFLSCIGNKTSGKVTRFDINEEHTHLLIFDDSSATDAVEKTDSTFDQFRNKIEWLFTRPLSYYRNKFLNSEQSCDESQPVDKPDKRKVPMVCLMIRGDLNSIDMIDAKIQKEIPVVILKGTGGAADIISFAYSELSENRDQDYEDSFVKPEILKKLLSEFTEDLINNDFIRNQYRDKIISIIKNGIKGSQFFVNVVDVKGMDFDFADLDEYFLTALLKSQTEVSGKHSKTQIDHNLSLTLDWNCPNLALTEIFQRDGYTQIEIKNALFEKAICSVDREEFVELFLDQGFCIHRYLGRNNIRVLFTRTEEQEFFVTVVLQGILGHFTSELPDNFFPDGLNQILKYLTSIDHMINILEIYMNQLGFYVTDAVQAEKKALNFLLLYAVIFNRHKLAKILWKRSENPILMALICSLIYKNICLYVHENYLKSQLEKYQKEFADAAIGVLDASFKENDPRAYAILKNKHTDWNDLTLFDLAYNAKNKNFIAHPCCQKILKKRLFGSIQIRDVDNSIPSWIKITLSAFLLIPMYRWIVFPIKKQVSNKKKISGRLVKHIRQDSEIQPNVNCDDTESELAESEFDEEEDDCIDQYEAEATKNELNKKLINEIKKKGPHSKLISYKRSLVEDTKTNHTNLKKLEKLQQTLIYEYISPPFYEKIHLIWSSPYTKFWMNFLSYLLFLALFSLVTLWPACGNLMLDSILWLWTATITIEETRVTYKNYLTGSQLPLMAKITEIGIMILFMALFFFIRIIGSWDGQLLGVDKVFASKVLLCLFLLYFYYRTVFTFLPISHQLGPMLVSMKMMIKNDFMTYLRLLLIFITACGIALNAIIYPYHPINAEFIKKTFLFRGILQIFVLDKDELETPSTQCLASGMSNKPNQSYQCVDLTDGIDFSYSNQRLNEYGVNYKCVQPSLFAWFVFIQYFFLIKLFLPTLLTAMFSNSISKVAKEAEQLWMFQRYEIVVEYEKRIPFGPPLSLLFYLYMIMRDMGSNMKKFSQRFRVCLKNCHLETASDKENNLNSMASFNKNCSTNVFNYWRNLAQGYYNDLEKQDSENSKIKKLDNTLKNVRTDIITQKKSIQRLNDRVIGLQQSLQSNQSYLEQIKNLLVQTDSKKGLIDRKLTNYIHILSRESPYLNTNLPRFFVNNKLVPWEVSIDLYDPPFVSFPVEYFRIGKIFIDEDLTEDGKNTIQYMCYPDSNINVVTQHGVISPSTPKFSVHKTRKNSKSSHQSTVENKNNFMWNCYIEVEDPKNSSRKIFIDRKSSIVKIDQSTSKIIPFIYSLDSRSYPKNPIGRTGIRGRGALPRYGPNKEIQAIVTRWKQSKNRPIYVDRRKLLEFIAVRDKITGTSKIPGDKILGDESKFSVVCRTFMEIVFEEDDVEKGYNFQLEDMTKFFCSFATKSLINFSLASPPYTDIFHDFGFVPTMIYSGYIDDQRNTDNAWIEAEIWNFHYDKQDFFDVKIKNPESKWREVSSNVRIASNEIISDALKEISEIHNGFYN